MLHVVPSPGTNTQAKANTATSTKTIVSTTTHTATNTVPKTYEPTLRIDNQFFTQDSSNNTIFSQIDCIGFTLYTIILANRNYSNQWITNITSLLSFYPLSCFRTTYKYLQLLQEHNLITFSPQELSANTPVQITVLEPFSTPLKEGFTLMNPKILLNELSTIQPIGWSLLCYLSRMHNYKYNPTTYVGKLYGCANPSQQRIMDVLNISRRILPKYITILSDTKLVKVFSQNQYNNIYIVQSRIPDHKYYMHILDKLHE